ncbi:trans-1,2-dihydrobenzene-1,2-diol dehydrogenase [Plakobranchus ocellatus]|uniref:Trans-1,2-dihydrobenzene-1,2-diol dehydrogenase n=1 Tax=Plakobranchus ocellatus TaxID=259542 RepID=A0AAV4C9I9_9GAST|nr:trans-1,2-dihydrobenzene-1,2-diol dehydrogenase [Plakobranchus ocellatus]
MASPTRWGILGAGKIAMDFCTCLSALPEHQIIAVAARSKDRANQFASEFDIPKAHSSYQEVMNDPDIDIVYVSTIHINHVELSLAAINAGKNVLCEKPMSLTLEGCQKVLAAAKEKNILFVEGIWSRFFPVYKFIGEQIESGALGDVHTVQASFTQCIWTVDRISKKELGGGGLMDLGVYLAQAAELVFKGKPKLIQTQGSLSDEGVDKCAVITLKYPGNKFAQLYYDTEVSGGANSLTIRGTKGNLHIPDCFWCPDRVVMEGNQVKYFQLPTIQDKLEFINSQGFCYQIQGIRECLLKGLKECPEVSHESSETIMYILTEVQRQLGVSYDFP